MKRNQLSDEWNFYLRQGFAFVIVLELAATGVNLTSSQISQPFH